ncbi:MAG TPA: TonB-dependent receptor [Steroidobacteraceae bacterium]|nr:TonB-dependent receptor [Steroidobacteraceae bacterium]
MSIRRTSTLLASLALVASRLAAADVGPAGPAPSTADSGELATVTVTAQHRTQASQDVPIAMQVVTTQEMQNVEATDLARMDGYIPGLSVSDEQPTQPGYTLRGISISDFGIGTDAPIGIYDDGVYAGKTGGALLLFDDVQRVEVLKGPQGTLFGRNSAAGAISVVSNAPTDEFAANATARFGNYGTEYLDAMVNAPLGDSLFGRVSLVDNRSDGWLRDDATGADYHGDGDWGLRAQLLWKAPADTSVRLIWEHENLNQAARPAISVVPLPPAPGLPTYPPNPATWISPFTAPLMNDVVDGRETRSFDGLTLRIEHSFDFGDFTSISAWRHFDTFNREDQDGTDRLYLYFDDANIEDNTSYSQEFTLNGKTALADWVVGASYYYDDGSQDSQLNLYTDTIDTLLNNTQGIPGGVFGPISAVTQPLLGISLLGDPWQESMFNHLYARAAALYGDVIWHVAPQWNLTTGLRYTDDDKDFSWYNPTRTAAALDASLAELTAVGFPLPPFPYDQNLVFNYPVSTAAPYRLHDSWSDVSPRAVLDYKPADSTLFYLSYSRGYEAGGYNALQPGAIYDPEYVSNYELGVKSELLDHRLLLNASVYYYLYTHLQNLTLVTNTGVIPEYEVTTSDQHASGIDFETRWQATDAMSLRLIAAYIDQTYVSYVAPDGTNLAGQAVGTPFWSMAGGLDYRWHEVFGGNLTLTLQGAYTGAQRCNADSAAQGSCLSIPAFSIGTSETRADARLGWTSGGRAPVTVAVYGNNLFDKQYATGINNITATTLGTPFTDITAPRFFGVELGIRY